MSDETAGTSAAMPHGEGRKTDAEARAGAAATPGATSAGVGAASAGGTPATAISATAAGTASASGPPSAAGTPGATSAGSAATAAPGSTAEDGTARADMATGGDGTHGGSGPSAAALTPRWAVVGIFLLLLIGALAYARQFLVPVMLGFLLTLVFSPVRRVLDRTMPSVVSALLIVGVIVALVIGATVLLAQPVATWVEDAPKIAAKVEERIREVRGAAASIVEAGEQIGDLASGTPKEPTVIVKEPGVLSSVALVAPGVAAQTAFVLALLFFLLASGDMVYEKIVHVMPTFRDKRYAIRIAFDIERKLSNYLLTITIINLALGAAIGVAMWLIGMPNPLLFALIGFLLNYVPYVGSMTGAAIACVVGLVSLNSAWEAAAAGGIYFSLTSLTGQFATPFFVSRRLRLNAVVVFLSVAMCAWLWSVVGMLIATPLLVTVRVFCEHIPPLENVGTFLSARSAERTTGEEEPEGIVGA